MDLYTLENEGRRSGESQVDPIVHIRVKREVEVIAGAGAQAGVEAEVGVGVGIVTDMKKMIPAEAARPADILKSIRNIGRRSAERKMNG